MKSKRNLTKITKRNTHKRNSKEAQKRELIKALRDIGVSDEGVKIRLTSDRGPRGGYYGDRSEDILSRGVYSGSKNGYGFVKISDGERDILEKNFLQIQSRYFDFKTIWKPIQPTPFLVI